LESNSGKELTLRDLGVIYKRRRKVIYSVVGVLVLLTGLYCIVATRRYEAVSMIEVRSKSQDGLALETIAGGTPDADGDALAANMNIQTQANILQSDTLALKVVKDLHLEDTADFRPKWNPIGWVMNLFSPEGAPEPANVSLDDSPKRRHHVLLIFDRFLTVKPVAGTRLLNVSFLSSDPKIAAAVVNDLTQSLMDYSYQTRSDATNQASSWLNSELSDLRKQTEDLQKQLATAQTKSGLYDLGTVDPTGHEQSYSSVLEQLQQATTALTLAEQNRILRGAIAHAADTGDAEMLSNLAGNTTNGATMNNTLGLIQNLRAQEATQEAALQQAQLKYGDANPKLLELRGNMAGLQKSIQQETERLKGRAKSDYEVAKRAEDDSRDRYNKIKLQADNLNNKSIDIAILRKEAEESSKLYEELLGKFKGAGVLEGLKGSMISVVDPGRVPSKPKKPNVPLYLGAALVGSFFLGCCLALVLDMTDHKVNTIHEVEAASAGNLIGITPWIKGKSVPDVMSLDEPQSPFVESLRGIRNAILTKFPEPASKVVLVTSSIPGEGKTTVSANLAVLLAQAGKRTLLVDTDLNHGAIREAFNLPSGAGLAELLTGQTQETAIHSVTTVPNLSALHTGSTTVDTSLLAGSFGPLLSAWRAKYDYIVLDSDSLLPATGPLVLSQLSDVTLLVAQPRLTESSQLNRSYELLSGNGGPAVASVLNGLRPGEDGYSSYFGFRTREQR